MPPTSDSAAPAESASTEHESLTTILHNKAVAAEQAVVRELEQLEQEIVHGAEHALGIGGSTPAALDISTAGATGTGGTSSVPPTPAADPAEDIADEPTTGTTPIDRLAPHTRIEKTRRGVAITLPDGRRIPGGTLLEAWAKAFPADGLT